VPEAKLPASVPAPSAARLVTALTLAGLLSGVAIASVYEATQPRILANKAAALRQAVYHVVPGADSMQACILRDGRVVVFDAAQDNAEGQIYATYDASGALIGYAIPDGGPGFQDAIQLIYGFDPHKKQIVGMKVLESRETPGLGDKIIKDAHFLENFAALAVEPEIALVKSGAKVNAHEVDAITGATISSRAIVRILNGSMQTWKAPLVSAASQEEGSQ
jgi:electron transport complex protein RnfG